jgi:LemA protein
MFGLGGIVFVFIIALVIVFVGISVYNNLIRLNQEIDRSWANIDVILKQRFDEIPQLVQVIEQYTQYEKSVIDQVTKARAHYGQAQNVNEKVQAANDLSVALRGIFAIGENYPELRSNQNFMQLQGRVSDLENSIADRRENFNAVVTNYNTRIQQIPDVFFANFLGYRTRDLYKIAQSETVRPSLKMNLPN